MKTGKSLRQYLYAAFLAIFLLGLAAPTAAFADDGTPAEIAEEPAAEAAQETDETAAEPATEPVMPAEEPAVEETLPEEASEVMQAIPQGTDLVVLDENGEALPLGSLQAEQVILNGDPMWCPLNHSPDDPECTAGAISFLGESGLLAQLSGKSGNGTIYVSYDYSALTNGEDFNQAIVIDQSNVEMGLAGLGNLTIQGGWNFGTNALDTNQPYSVLNLGTGSFTILNWTGDIQIKNIQMEDTTGGSLYGGALVFFDRENGGDVLLQDVTVINSGGHAVDGTATNERSGAKINTKGNITINGSRFDGNKSVGLYAFSQGNIAILDVQALANEGHGVSVENCNNDYENGGGCLNQGSVTLSGTNTFGLKNSWIDLGNTETGLYIQTGGKVSADANTILNASGNGYNGVVIDRANSDTSQPIELLGTNTFNDNFIGLVIRASGPITLNSITANSNSYDGVFARSVFDLDPGWGENELAAGLGGTLTISGTNNFNDNGVAGLEAYVDGKITASNLNANGNRYIGALLSTCAGYYNEENEFISFNDPAYNPDETYEFYKENVDYDVTISGINVFGSTIDGEPWGNGLLSGLIVYTYGDINLGTTAEDRFTVQNNEIYGAELHTGIYQSTYDPDNDNWYRGDVEEIFGGGNVTLKGTHLYGGYDSENDWGNGYDGLCIYAESDDPNNGNVTMENALEASGNDEQGVFIYATGFVNVSGSAKLFDFNEDGLFISNSNGAEVSNIESNDNYGTGIWVGDEEGMGAVVVDQCEANGNDYSGMYFKHMSSLKISNSDASGNGLDYEYSGIDIEIEGDVTLKSVTANDNGWAGFEISAEDVTIKNATTSGNYGSGILINPAGNVLVKNSESSRNSTNGLEIYRYNTGIPGDDTISCSTFNDNAVYGLTIDLGDEIYLWGVNASDNGVMDIVTRNVGEIFESPNCDGGACVCQPADADEPPALQGLIVPVVGIEKVALECGYAWTMLKLGSQDSAKFSGLCGGQLAASLSSFSADGLPAPLPEGSVMGSGIEAGVDGAVILPGGGWMQITFNVPADMQGKTHSILFWDAAAGEWVSLPLFGEGGFAASDAAMQVLAGVQVNPDGSVTATVNFGGTFVLVAG